MSQELRLWLNKGTYFQYNGNKVFYIREGSGLPLLVFHGYPFNGYDFKEILPALAGKFQVIIPDMPGMGFSDKPVNYSYSFGDYANMFCSLLSELKVETVHILAHDLGNSVVQELLSQQQEKTLKFKITSIAFLNGGLFSDVYKPRFIQVLLSKSPSFIGKRLSRLMSKKMVSKATAEVFGKNTKPSEMLQQQFWEILNYNNGKSIAYLLGRLVFQKEKYQERWITAMQQTNIPMCFINGPADPNSGIHMAVRYKQLIPDANVKLLQEDIGHWPQIEAPDSVLENYFEFIKSCKIN